MFTGLIEGRSFVNNEGDRYRFRSANGYPGHKIDDRYR